MSFNRRYFDDRKEFGDLGGESITPTCQTSGIGETADATTYECTILLREASYESWFEVG